MPKQRTRPSARAHASSWGVAAAVSAHGALSEANPVGVERHRDMNVLVRIDPHNHRTSRAI